MTPEWMTSLLGLLGAFALANLFLVVRVWATGRVRRKALIARLDSLRTQGGDHKGLSAIRRREIPLAAEVRKEGQCHRHFRWHRIIAVRNTPVRLGGAMLVGASWAVSLWLRELMAGEEGPTLLQAGLVLVSFVLALGGLVLIIKGARLFPRRPGDGGSESSLSRTAGESLSDDRAALADALARRAIRAMREERHRQKGR